MQGNLTIIGVDGNVAVSPLTETPSLEALQAGVGGHIETVPYFTKYRGETCVAFCNEEGKIKGMPSNPTAHELWEKAYGAPIWIDHLVGPIVIITGDQEIFESL